MTKQRVLVIFPNWIGDAVMAQPLLQLLQMQSDVIEIDALATPWVSQVVRAMPEVKEVIETPFRHGALQIRERLAFAKILKARNYDAAYILPNTLKFALLPWLAGIPVRVGYKGESRYGLVNRMHFDSKPIPRPMVSFYAALAFPPSKYVPVELPKPRLFTSDQNKKAVFNEFGLHSEYPLLVIAPGAEFGNAKRWPAEHFADLAKKINDEVPDLQIVLLGSGKDLPVCEEIKSLFPNVSILAGKTNLMQAVSLIAAAKLVIGNDSGLLHIASALNRPVAGIYGPTDPDHAPPFSDISWKFSLKLACAPCKQRECPLGHHRCMQDLSPDTITAETMSIFKVPLSNESHD